MLEALRATIWAEKMSEEQFPVCVLLEFKIVRRTEHAFKAIRTNAAARAARKDRGEIFILLAFDLGLTFKSCRGDAKNVGTRSSRSGHQIDEVLDDFGGPKLTRWNQKRNHCRVLGRKPTKF